MTMQYFVQHADASIINQFRLPKNTFHSIDIGIRKMESDFLFEAVQNLFSFPIIFVLENADLVNTENTLLEKSAVYIKDNKDTLIVKVDSLEILEAICEDACELAANGLSVFIFKGDGLSEKDCLVSRNKNGLIEFPNLDFHLLETFIDMSEVGLTLFTTNENYNSPVKLVEYVSSRYEIDSENSDID